MKKRFLLILLCVFLLCGCGKIPKLANGEEAVITFSKGDTEHKISADDLYKELKNNFGLEATVKLIDTYVLETEFKDYTETAKKNAKNFVDAMLESYGSEEELLDDIRYYTNYETIEAYQEYLYTSYLQSHALEEYAKSLVKDEEIEKYYKDEAKGDVEVYHILITPQVTSTMTDDEKKKADEDAKAKAEEVIKKLNDASDKLEEFKKLVKEYTEDDATKDKDGNLGFINYDVLGEEYDELLDAVYKIKDGEYSKNVVKTELGYHIIYRNSSKEKDTLENLKDSIKEKLAERKISADSKMSVNSMKYYRELYNMEIVDSELKRQYGIYINNLLNSSETN